MLEIRRPRSPNPLSDLTRVEDYIEVIYELIETKGYARPVEIAERLEISSPSVTTMLQKLHSMGLILYERHRGLTLTSNGERLARSVQQRHLTILKFLRVLQIQEDIAKSDAEGIEHHLHKSTVDRIECLVDYIIEHPPWFETFEKTLQKAG